MSPTIIVAGVMSGTSADGINVALLRIGSDRDSGFAQKLDTETVFGAQGSSAHTDPASFQLLGHAEYSYSQRVRAAVLTAMSAPQASVADLSRLNFLLGELYADAVLATEKRLKVKAELIGCHGQTLYHQGEPGRFLGRRVAATWQTGEAAVIAARTGVPVVSDFRPADLAAGGKGAPLVPYLDCLVFRDAHSRRIVQNIGGVANLTAIPAGAAVSDVIAFDTGPGNMVIDAVTDKLFGRPFDRDGTVAASGRVLEPVVRKILQHQFFRKKPPKTAGREEFGREFVAEFLRMCRGGRKQDVVATATALTAKSIADAVKRFVLQKAGFASIAGTNEMILSGGGAKNRTLVKMLSSELALLGVPLRFSDEFGLPSAAKEAAAFALLAYETWHRRPSNIPSATGAQRPAVLGKIAYP